MKKSLNNEQRALNFALEIFAVVLFLGCVIGGYFIFADQFTGKIFPKVNIAGLSVGGKTKPEAQEILEEHLKETDSKGPVLVYGNKRFEPTLGDLGVTYNVSQTVDNAFKYGRNSNWLNLVKENFTLAFLGYNSPMVMNLDRSKMDAYLNTVASKIAVAKVDRLLLDTNREVVQEGSDGQELNKDILMSDLENFLSLGKTGSRIEIPLKKVPRAERTVKAAFIPGEPYWGKYIEIDLAKQTLYAYDNNKLINHFLISSGTAAHPTIVGIYSVYGKSRVTEMNGPGYDMPGVEWVSWWHGDYSIHGTYWHKNFGHPMSHGCINASNENAKWVYNWDSIGTPVWVHK